MKLSKNMFLVVAVVIASVAFISFPFSNASEKDNERKVVNQNAHEQSIMQRLQTMFIDSYVYYLRTSGQVEAISSIRIDNFPILTENSFIDKSQQPFHSEQFFSDLYATANHTSNITSIKENKVISISNLPVTRGFLSSRYGMRKDPINGLSKMHKGIDIAARYGADVNPLGNGIVSYAGYKLGYGNTVEIKHGRTVVTRYAHLKQFLVSVDQEVTTTDIIGQVGSTGRSTGPHLHLEVLLNSNHTDPQIFLANYFGSGTNKSRVAAIKPKIQKTVQTPSQSAALKPTQVTNKELVPVLVKGEYRQIKEFPQVSYSDYVKSVDGLFGFSAPESFSR